MPSVYLSSATLEAARQIYSENSRISLAIDAVLEEEDAYAADELVVLAEEVLLQIAAVGFVHYLKRASQKEIYNDFLVELFTSKGQEYNAGPLYRWAANMVKDCAQMQSEEAFSFFWEREESGFLLASRVQHLAELRNQVMHGFFVLPPEKNKQEADAIGHLLLDLNRVGFLDVEADHHFYRSGFTGKWEITGEEEWSTYFSLGVFGSLAKRVVEEQNPSFWENEQPIATGFPSTLPKESKKVIMDFVEQHQKGALGLWIHPADNRYDAYIADVHATLSGLSNTTLISYGLYEQGISFTGPFLLKRLQQVLLEQGNSVGKNKRLEDAVAALRKQTKNRIVVLIHRFHLALFSPQHVSKLNNFLYENSIHLIAVGHCYEHFNSYFNAQHIIEHAAVAPTLEQGLEELRNYLRFKGPSKERPEEVEDVQLLETVLSHVLQALGNGERLYARRFADAHQYPMEYVHEIFALLHPWVRSDREVFEADTWDELYGFPSIMTEVTPIYLALGRRDLNLEYQHKVISL